MTMIKVITGWQTWIDQWALAIAKSLAIQTWWNAPHQFRTESWRATHLEWEYWVKELKNGWLLQRTKLNIKESDWTIVIKPTKKHESPWTDFTIEECKRQGKPFVVLYADANVNVLKWAEKLLWCKVINVAWPRESKISNSQRCKDIIEQVLNFLKKD